MPEGLAQDLASNPQVRRGWLAFLSLSLLGCLSAIIGTQVGRGTSPTHTEVADYFLFFVAPFFLIGLIVFFRILFRANPR